MNIKKTATSLALIAFIAINSTPLNAGVKDSMSNLFTNTTTLVKPYYEKIVNCPYLIPSLTGAGLLYCNYASYCDYHQLTLIPKEDRIEAAKTIAEFICKTILLGRSSYVDSLNDNDYHGLVHELSRGYRDVVEGSTSFVLVDFH